MPRPIHTRPHTHYYYFSFALNNGKKLVFYICGQRALQKFAFHLANKYANTKHYIHVLQHEKFIIYAYTMISSKFLL